MSRQQLKERGFTIIEVVLVLAIAALIFLMVFIALPALQRNQRDQDRKTTQTTVGSEATAYASNNRGAMPSDMTKFKGYINADDDGVIDGGKYKVVLTDSTTDIVPIADQEGDYELIHLVRGAKCKASGDGAEDAAARNGAVLMRMENGDQLTCVGV